MSTRVHALTFAAGQTQVLPQGRYWLIKSASSALNIELVRRNGQPEFIDNVGAGTKYNGLESGRWYEMKVTSAGVQNVEIVIADESSVDFTNAVSVTGTAATAELPAAALSTPAVDTILTAAALSVPANAARRRMTISNTGTDTVYIQAPAAGAGRGIPLSPGTYVEVKGVYAFDVRNDTGVSQTVTRFEES